MVQTYQSPVRVYKYPFELVMAAYHKRFPTCPQIPIFVGSEITYEWKADDGGEEIVERKCQLNVEAPYLVKKIAGVEYVYFKQRNHLNMRQRTLAIEASNISFSSRIVVIENCKYYVHTDNPEWTCFEQSASLDVKSFFGFEAAVEKLAVKQYGANIAKGKEVLEHFIDDLIKNGTTHAPRWTPPDGSKAIECVEGEVTATPADSAIDIANGTVEGMVHTNAEGEKDRSPPSTPPHTSSSGIGSSSTTITTGDLFAPPLSGTAEEKLSREELKRRRSSGAGGPKHSKTAHDMAVMSGAKTTAHGAVARTNSFDDMESKLESEYIQRFLGQLTPLEESRLCELKYGLQNAHKGKIPNDAHLLRFLRARDFDTKRATQMVVNSLLWRKQHNVDKILHEFIPPAVLLKYFPGGWHKHDNEGRPVFILRLGQMDIKGLLRSVGLEPIVKFTLSICEQGLIKTAEATHRLGKPISTWTLLVDLEGLSMRHLWRPGIQCLLRIIEIVENNYPETMGLVLITRAPRAFPLLWTLISPFIDDNTRKKFELYASEQVLQELARYIPKEFLPDFLGGPSHFEMPNIADGPPWLVPKSNYLPVSGDELLKENAVDVLSSQYTNVTVNKGVPHEICLWINAAGSVLTWDFDILKGECEFVIYHTDKKITAAREPQSSAQQLSISAPNTAEIPSNPSQVSTQTTAATAPATSSSAKGPVEMVERVVDSLANEISNLLSSDSAPPHFHAIAAEPEFRLGAELTLAEKPLTFADGDSMQGSHYCAKPGTYILQWRHPADISHERKDSLPNAGEEKAEAAAEKLVVPKEKGPIHKCRLMVYHEVLNSADFKGSVASLQSCRSSFNSLAAVESLHSSDPNSPNAKRRIRHNVSSSGPQQAKEEDDDEEDTTTDQTPKAQ